MTMKSVFSAALLIGFGSIAPPQAVYAGNVTNASLACLVETNALEQYRSPTCRSYYRGPGYGTDPTIASFKVQGLTAGSYSFTWVDLETGQAPNCSSSQATCTVPIGTDVYGDGYAELAVTIRDLSTGATKTVSARAFYIDAYH